MELERLKKLFEKSEQDATELAKKAIFGSTQEPSFHKAMEDQNRRLAEQIGNLVGNSDIYRSRSESFARMQKILVETTRSLIKPTEDLSLGLASLVPHLNSNLEGVQDFLKREAEQQRKTNERFLESITAPKLSFERQWMDHEVKSPSLASLQGADTQESDAQQFFRQLNKHRDDAEKTAAESNGVMLVTCTSPSGEKLRNFSLSSEDGHFIKVSGVDEFQQVREWIGTSRSIDITIEVLTRDEDVESLDEDIEPIN